MNLYARRRIKVLRGIFKRKSLLLLDREPGFVHHLSADRHCIANANILGVLEGREVFLSRISYPEPYIIGDWIYCTRWVNGKQ